MRCIWLAIGLAATLSFLGPLHAHADTTTILCKYRAPQGKTLQFVFDLPKELLIQGPDIMDGGATTNAPLTVTENEIAWTTNDGWRMVLDRTTLVLAGNGIDAFDCRVGRKQV